MSDWQPIETAPKNIGRCLVVADDPFVCSWHFAYRSEGDWIDLGNCEPIQPTHWMLLPEPPALAKASPDNVGVTS